jgi:DNA replication protein DnaC
VQTADPLAPRITPAFLEYAQSRGFHIDTARVRSPRDKGRVERAVQPVRADQMLKALKHARLDNSHEVELRKLIAVDLLIVDDFCLDTMDTQESRDAYEILTERHRSGSMIVTSNRGPDEWLATFADPMRAQRAIDRFTNNS